MKNILILSLFLVPLILALDPPGKKEIGCMTIPKCGTFKKLRKPTEKKRNRPISEPMGFTHTNGREGQVNTDNVHDLCKVEPLWQPEESFMTPQTSHHSPAQTEISSEERNKDRKDKKKLSKKEREERRRTFTPPTNSPPVDIEAKRSKSEEDVRIKEARGNGPLRRNPTGGYIFKPVSPFIGKFPQPENLQDSTAAKDEEFRGAHVYDKFALAEELEKAQSPGEYVHADTKNKKLIKLQPIEMAPVTKIDSDSTCNAAEESSAGNQAEGLEITRHSSWRQCKNTLKKMRSVRSMRNAVLVDESTGVESIGERNPTPAAEWESANDITSVPMEPGATPRSSPVRPSYPPPVLYKSERLSKPLRSKSSFASVSCGFFSRSHTDDHSYDSDAVDFPNRYLSRI